jgi:glycosyltransferase involved in cell wall biosynthesis
VRLVVDNDLLKYKNLRKQRKGSSFTTFRISGTGENKKELPRPGNNDHTNKYPNRVECKDDKKTKVKISCPVFYNGSFGVVGRGIAEALDIAGFDVGFKIWKEGDRSIELKPVINKMVKNNITDEDISIRVSHPDSFTSLRHMKGYKIGVGVTEEREIRYKAWLRGFKFCDQVWTPSTFCKKTFEKHGIKNVHVVPNGYDPKIFNPEVEPYNYDIDNFVFLHLGVMQRRKGTNLLIEAFIEEFDEDEATLVIKSFTEDADEKGVSFFRKNIIMIRENVPAEKMGSFYRGADAFVLPTRAEGFGMPILEAMACKLPVIVTNYSGHLDFCNNENSFLIECNNYDTQIFSEKEDFVSASTKALGAQPNKEHLKFLMRYVYEHRNEKPVEDKIKKAYEIAKHYTWENIGNYMRYLLRNVGKKMKEKVGSWSVIRQSKADVTYYDCWCGDSFAQVGSEHRKILKKNYDVHSIAISGLKKNEVGYSDLAIIHPLMYNEDLIVRAKRFYKVAGGCDVADSDHITKFGVNILNNADFVIVPTEKTKDTYIRSGVNIPVYVCPHSLRSDFYNERKVLDYIPQDKINVLFFLRHSVIRKGADIVEKIARKFNDDAVFWTRGGNVKYTKRVPWLDKKDLTRAYDSCDILLCPSRGGGFEMNVLEGMSRGLICLTSDWESITEYSNGISICSNTKKRQPLPNNYIHDGYGAEPNIKDAYKKFQYYF